THNRANANTAEVHQTSATLHALVDLLVERGLLDEEELKSRQQQVAEQLRKLYVGKGMAVALQEFGISKYAFEGSKDKRIWSDFENEVVNRRIYHPEWPACLEAEAAGG